ncbi:MAG: ArsA-related P-loop ATPase [Patulibacter sp.]
MSGSLVTRLADAKVVVCAGPGGVGKTTTAAALGVALARTGRRVCVVTIDPARRLAEALGIGALTNDPTPVDGPMLGLPDGGALWAMMLDPQRTFDGLINELSPDAETRDRLLANPLYRHVSSAAGGGHEFTAVARLHDLAADPRFDVVVLDTPPSRNALDFLDAPDRISAVLEGRAIRALLGAGKTGFAARLAQKAIGVGMAALQRLTGIDVLRDMQAFFDAIGPLSDGFVARATAVRALLRDADTHFVVITSPEPVPAAEALALRRHLDQVDMPFRALVVNRVTPAAMKPEGPHGGEVAVALRAALDPALAAMVAAAWEEDQQHAAADRQAIAELTVATGDHSPTVLATLPGDVADLAALARIAERLSESR